MMTSFKNENDDRMYSFSSITLFRNKTCIMLDEMTSKAYIREKAWNEDFFVLLFQKYQKKKFLTDFARSYH